MSAQTGLAINGVNLGLLRAGDGKPAQGEVVLRLGPVGKEYFLTPEASAAEVEAETVLDRILAKFNAQEDHEIRVRVQPH